MEKSLQRTGRCVCVWGGCPQSSAEQAAAPSWKPGSALGITRLLLYTPGIQMVLL